MIFIFGHKNPDTDSIVAPLVWEKFLKRKKIKAKAFRQGKLNQETKFVLNFFKVPAPNLKTKVKPNQKIILLDHNLYRQAPEGAKEADLIQVIDHHFIGDFQTQKPIYYRSEPVGSTSTIIAKIFLENRLKPSQLEAKLLLSGLISDTLNLTSPTTTNEDRKIAKFLEEIAQIKRTSLAQKMFQAKSSLKGLNLKEIILKDFKEFETKNKKFGIGVWETLAPQELILKAKNLKKEISELRKKKNLNFLFFGIVDIFKKICYFILSEVEAPILKKAFLGKIQDEILIAKGIVSRKKQMVPPLLKILSKNEISN